MLMHAGLLFKKSAGAKQPPVMNTTAEETVVKQGPIITHTDTMVDAHLQKNCSISLFGAKIRNK